MFRQTHLQVFPDKHEKKKRGWEVKNGNILIAANIERAEYQRTMKIHSKTRASNLIFPHCVLHTSQPTPTSGLSWKRYANIHPKMRDGNDARAYGISLGLQIHRVFPEVEISLKSFEICKQTNGRTDRQTNNSMLSKHIWI